MLVFLFAHAPPEAASEAPPWWFLASVVIAIFAIALFTMRLALSSSKRRGQVRLCPACGAKVQLTWVRCPVCGGQLGPEGAARGGAGAGGAGGGGGGGAAPYVGPAEIQFKSGPLSGRTYPLERDVTTVGSVDGNSVILQDTGVSRKHVGIRKVDGGYELADLGSTNGVFVNGEKTARRRLVAGDVIRIGTSEALFRA